MSEELEAVAASLPAQEHRTTIITIDGVTGDQLTVKYRGLPNNLPNSYGNYLAVWKNENTVAWNDTDTAGYVVIGDNKSQGSQTFDNIIIGTDATYVVGYAVGPKAAANQIFRNVCTTGFIPLEINPDDPGSSITYLTPDITVTSYGSSSVALRFTLPAGALPKTNGAWVGIFKSSQASYTAALYGSNSINIDSETGGASINSVQIARTTTYTVALFASGWKAGAGGVNVQTAMVATSTFTTP